MSGLNLLFFKHLSPEQQALRLVMQPIYTLTHRTSAQGHELDEEQFQWTLEQLAALASRAYRLLDEMGAPQCKVEY